LDKIGDQRYDRSTTWCTLWTLTNKLTAKYQCVVSQHPATMPRCPGLVTHRASWQEAAWQQMTMDGLARSCSPLLHTLVWSATRCSSETV